MSQSLKKHWPVILILVVSLVTHFSFFGHPNETVFDEVHFGKFISGYFTHEYFFDIHPPLGKLIISGAGYLTSFKPGFSFANIGEKFPDNSYLWLRLLPTLAGVLLPIIIYLLALRLGLSRLASTTLSLLLALENAFIVQSRFILLDSFLLLFGFSALLAYFRFRADKTRWRWFVITGVLASLSISVKWTGLSFLGIIFIIEALDLLKKPNIKSLGLILVSLITVPLILYCSIFVIHLELLTKTGPGDAFMTPQFRKTLIGSYDSTNPSVQPLNMLQKIVELNVEMYQSNATLTATHPYSSKWYTWPFMQRPIYYWHGSDTRILQLGQNIAPKDSRIYFLGNPIIWFLSTIAILYLILDQLGSLYRKRKLDFLPGLIIGAYVVNMLPFVGITRAMFLYHYMIGYIFALLALIYLIDKIPNQVSWIKSKTMVCAIVIIASIASFLYFSPLTYGTPLTEKAYNFRAWLPSWK